jgi:hypothetical protein
MTPDALDRWSTDFEEFQARFACFFACQYLRALLTRGEVPPNLKIAPHPGKPAIYN